MIDHLLQSRLLRWLWFVVLGFFLSFPLSNKAAAVKPNDNPELLRIVDALVSAWNRHDAELIAGFFLPDAVLMMPTGKMARTRSGIRERLLDEWSGKLQDTALSHTIESVSFENKDTAIVKGKYRLEGVKFLGLEKSPEGSFIFRQKRERGRWMIAKAELLRSNDS